MLLIITPVDAALAGLSSAFLVNLGTARESTIHIDLDCGMSHQVPETQTQNHNNVTPNIVSLLLDVQTYSDLFLVLPQYYHVSCMEFILDFATLARATPEPSCAYNGQSKFLSERGRKMLLRWQAQDYRSDAGVKCSHSRLMADHEGVEQIDNIPRNLLGFLWQPMSEDDYKYINDLDNCFRERDGEPLFLRENGGSTKYSASKSQTSVALSTPSTPLKLTLSQFDFYLQSFITERRKARGPRRCSNEEREWRPLKAEERNALREDLGLSPEAL